MTPRGSDEDLVGGLPPQVELVNLTPHPVKIRARSVPRVEDDADGERLIVLPQPAPVEAGRPVLTPARVVEDELPPTGQVVRTGDALIRLVRLRRSSTVTGLPRPVQGRLYVVSRPTAMAATRRDDLVVPHGELRDATQVIESVQGLATFRAPLVSEGLVA